MIFTVCMSKKMRLITLALIVLLAVSSQAANASLEPVNEGHTYSIGLPGSAGDFAQVDGPIDINYDGSVYRFQVSLPAPIDHFDGAWACCTNHWAYKVTSPLNPGKGTVIGDPASQTGDSYLCSIRWMAPAEVTNVSIAAGGKMRPWGEGGGPGEEYDWNCEWQRNIKAQVDIQVSGTTEENEENPGAFIALNGTRAVTLQLNGQMPVAGKVHVSIPSTDIAMMLDVPDAEPLGQQFDLDLSSGGTINCKIEGKAITDEGITVTVTFTPTGASQTSGNPDRAMITVFGVEIAEEDTYKYISREGGSFKYTIKPPTVTVDNVDMQLGSMLRSTTTGDNLGKTGEVTYTWVRKQGEENLMVPENSPFTLTVTATKDNSPAIDSWTGPIIVEVDIDVDSNNDGYVDPDNDKADGDDKIEENAPGQLVSCSQNSLAFVPATLAHIPISGLDGCTVQLAISEGTDKIKIWNADKSQELNLNTVWTIGAEPAFPTTVHVQGIAPGTAMLDMIVRAPGENGAEISRDKVKFTAYKLDIDIAGMDETAEDTTGGYAPICETTTKDLVDLIMDIEPVELRSVDNLNVTLSIANGASKIKLWNEQQRDTEINLSQAISVSEFPKHIWIEGLTESQSLRDVEIKLESSDQPAGSTDSVKLTVFKGEVVRAGDYIVPGSSQNAVQYKVYPLTDFTADTITVEVSDKDDNICRTLNNLPVNIDPQTGYNTALWNGMNDAGNPLSSTAAPYKYLVKVGKSQHTSANYSTVTPGIKTWAIGMVASDQPYGDSTAESGIDENTITTSRFVVKVTPSSGTETTIGYYEVTPDTGSNELDADVWLRNDANNYYIFYSTPTRDPNLPIIEYTVAFDQIEGGITDVAENQWDMYDSTDAIDTHGTWVFGIDGSGTIVNFSETYQ